MTYIYNFALYPGTKDYTACYEWRKVVLKSDVWCNLPQEMVEQIAKACICITEMQPSGSCNLSNLSSVQITSDFFEVLNVVPV